MLMLILVLAGDNIYSREYWLSPPNDFFFFLLFSRIELFTRNVLLGYKVIWYKAILKNIRKQLDISVNSVGQEKKRREIITGADN